MRTKLFSTLAALMVIASFAAKAEDKVGPSPTPEKVELPKADADGWISLFNGKDLTGWYGDPKVWRVENGYISGKAEKVPGNTFLIYNQPFKDFTLEAKFILVKAGKFPNSGIQYRSKVKNEAKWVVGGYQADIGDNYHGSLYDEASRGKLLFTAPKEVAATVKADDWNVFVVNAQGTKVKHTLNGVAAGEFDDQDEKFRSLEGIIALQYHAPGENFEIKFKDIRIKPIEEKK